MRLVRWRKRCSTDEISGSDSIALRQRWVFPDEDTSERSGDGWGCLKSDPCWDLVAGKVNRSRNPGKHSKSEESSSAADMIDFSAGCRTHGPTVEACDAVFLWAGLDDMNQRVCRMERSL